MSKNKKVEELKEQIVLSAITIHKIITNENLDDEIKEELFNIMLLGFFSEVEELEKYE